MCPSHVATAILTVLPLAFYRGAEHVRVMP